MCVYIYRQILYIAYFVFVLCSGSESKLELGLKILSLFTILFCSWLVGTFWFFSFYIKFFGKHIEKCFVYGKPCVKIIKNIKTETEHCIFAYFVIVGFVFLESLKIQKQSIVILWVLYNFFDYFNSPPTSNHSIFSHFSR